MDWRSVPHLAALAATDPSVRAALEALDHLPESAEQNVLIIDELIARLHKCPHWRNGGCACGSDLCVFPWRRRRVSARDCADCLSAT